MKIIPKLKREIALLGKIHTPGEIRKLLHNKGIELSYSQIVYYADHEKAKAKQRKATKRHYYKRLNKPIPIDI